MKKRKILLVDDEEDLLHMMKLNLEVTGKFDVVTENKGAKGLEMAKKHRPDLIILDFRMPDMHGSDVALHIQSDKEVGHIPIIFLTAVATREDLIEHGSEELCNYVLSKPATTDEIISAIEENLGKKSKLGFLKTMFNKKKEITWHQ